MPETTQPAKGRGSRKAPVLPAAEKCEWWAELTGADPETRPYECVPWASDLTSVPSFSHLLNGNVVVTI